MLMPSIFGENLIDDFFNDFAKPVTRYSNSVNTIMKTDVKETDQSYELDIDLPGYKKEDIKAELKDGYMTISAQNSTKNDEKDKDGKYIRRERYYGNCSRTFYVGDEITQEDIKAKFEDGILKITVPKKEAKPQVEEKSFITIEG
ncbi:MAG: Hsp20/alpha crystallin family protein [Lachnospiraceae bacterium]|nr:Hsp20/alpha crystallin family protein [Lachnospiraceae bacterium]